MFLKPRLGFGCPLSPRFPVCSGVCIVDGCLSFLPKTSHPAQPAQSLLLLSAPFIPATPLNFLMPCQELTKFNTLRHFPVDAIRLYQDYHCVLFDHRIVVLFPVGVVFVTAGTEDFA